MIAGIRPLASNFNLSKKLMRRIFYHQDTKTQSSILAGAKPAKLKLKKGGGSSRRLLFLGSCRIGVGRNGRRICLRVFALGEIAFEPFSHVSVSVVGHGVQMRAGFGE